MIYFTSDLHFGHQNLCLGLRGMTAEESDNLIITNWNNLVTKRDKVFILGDINMEKPKDVIRQLSMLKGQKEVIIGNHDYKSVETLVNAGIKVCASRRYKQFLLTHIPVHPSQLEGLRGNIHGHIHIPGFIEGLGEYKPKTDLGPMYYNVNTELHNYTPILFETILSYFEREKA